MPLSQAVVAPDMDNIKAVYLAAEDLKIAASILYQAYHDDPLFMDIFQFNKEGYESRLRSAIREELNAFWQARQPMIGLFDDGRLLAVACLLTAGYFGTKQMVDKEQKVREHIPAKRYHMLSFIGVHPDYQHYGLGHILMSAIDSVMKEDSGSEGIGVYVTLPKCLSFFEDGQYKMLEALETGHITGHLMFCDRQ